MRISPAKIVPAVLLFATLPGFASTHRHSTTRVHKSLRSSHSGAPAGIATERATQIQQALIQKGYLSGEPTGVWDSQTSAALAKLQGDNGWQTRITPDARALIKLGLGPQQPAADQTLASNK